MSPQAHAPKFQRAKLEAHLAHGTFEKIVQETVDLLERRFDKLDEFDSIQKSNFNPLLLLITAPAYNLYSPLEVAERMQLAKAFHGDDTAFGRFGEEKLLPLFGSGKCAEKAQHGAVWEPIDCEMTLDGQRYLFSLKAGPWTMNQSHANAMIEKLPAIHNATGSRIVLGIMYGQYKNLNNKPALVDTGLGSPSWFDYMVGRDFWEFVSGVKDVHKTIFQAIREAQKTFAERHKDETFQERLVSTRLKISSSLRKEFNVAEDEDFWSTLFNNMF